jgi:hypothetical protein
MTTSYRFLPVAAIITGILLAACGAFAAIPTLTPVSIPTLVPPVTPTAIPTATKLPPATAKLPEPATATSLPLASDTPVGMDGKTLLTQRCNACHPSDYVTQLRGTADQWAGLVSTMVQNGADLNPQEQQVLANYLAQTYH